MASSTSSRFSAWETIDRRSNQRKILVQSLKQINSTFPQLSSVKSCAMLGCGYGYLDLDFVTRYLPNVEKLTAVEPDADQMAKLKSKVAELLPNVGTEFCQQTAQSWNGGDEPFDAVLLFHCLYYVPQFERPALFKKLFDRVVAHGGLVFVLISPCSLEKPTAASRLLEILNLPLYGFVDDIDGEQVREMMRSAGFRDRHQLSLEYHLDAAEPSDDLMAVFVYWSLGMLGEETVREAFDEVLDDDRCLRDDASFSVFEKP